MLGLGLPEAERNQTLELCPPVFLQFVRHRAESKFGFDPTSPKKAPTAERFKQTEASAYYENDGQPPNVPCHHYSPAEQNYS
jgi:hypothetical protein